MNLVLLTLVCHRCVVGKRREESATGDVVCMVTVLGHFHVADISDVAMFIVV